MIPSHTYRYTLKKGLQGHDVWALQINLNKAISADLVEDGDFGDGTLAAVKNFQDKANITIDGVAGVHTQQSLALWLIAAPQKRHSIPGGLMRGLVEGEAGWVVGAVNWSVAGGVDCGWVQRRVYEGNFTDAAFHKAFDGFVQFELVADELRVLKDKFRQMPGGNTDEKAWKLAILNHNWPSGAAILAKGGHLSNTAAQWVMAIGIPGVITPAQWAEYYVNSKIGYVTSWGA